MADAAAGVRDVAGVARLYVELELKTNVQAELLFQRYSC